MAAVAVAVAAAAAAAGGRSIRMWRARSAGGPAWAVLKGGASLAGKEASSASRTGSVGGMGVEFGAGAGGCHPGRTTPGSGDRSW